MYVTQTDRKAKWKWGGGGGKKVSDNIIIRESITGTETERIRLKPTFFWQTKLGQNEVVQLNNEITFQIN